MQYMQYIHRARGLMLGLVAAMAAIHGGGLRAQTAPAAEAVPGAQPVVPTPPDVELSRAVSLIDVGQAWPLAEARAILEKLIARDPQMHAAYIEMARVAMKTNWGPEGLYQAEKLLESALQIEPASVNAKILLGYVYAHQKRYRPAEALFAQAASTQPPNLWLWTNWGEVLAMQGKTQEAVGKYREAIRQPRSFSTYDRARQDAYDKLLALLDEQGEVQGMDALHRQRVKEYGQGSCHAAAYGRFLLERQGDAPGAIHQARQAVEGHCRESMARDTLGLAHYTAWLGQTGPQKAASLNVARIFLPSGPRAFYLLAASERTAAVIKPLQAAGDAIEQRDNEGYTALAHALHAGDAAAVGRLIKAGAKATTPVGHRQLPVAFIPVFRGDPACVDVLRKSGVDFSRLRFEGMSATDYARQMGDRALLEALDPKAGAL